LNGIQPKGWSGKGFCKNVCNLEICTNVEKIELFTLELLLQPFEVDVLSLGHDSDSRLVVLHELYLIEFRETSFEGVDIRNTATRIDIPITDIVNFGVNPSEHSIFLGLRGIAS